MQTYVLNTDISHDYTWMTNSAYSINEIDTYLSFLVFLSGVNLDFDVHF